MPPAQRKDDILHAEIPSTLPLMALRSTIVYPLGTIAVQMGAPENLALLKANEQAGLILGLVVASGDHDDVLDPDRFVGRVGVAARVHERINLPGETVQITLQGLRRLIVEGVVQTDPFAIVRVKPAKEIAPDPNEVDDLINRIVAGAETLAELIERIPDEVPAILKMNISDPGRFADLAATNLNFKVSDKDEILQRLNIGQRLKFLLGRVEREVGRARVAEDVKRQTEIKIEQHQREFYLRQQLRAIQSELGEGDPGEKEAIETLKKLEEANLPEKAAQEGRREIERMRNLSPASSEYQVIRTYIDWMLTLPWNVKSSKDEIIELKKVEELLDSRHYGLKEAKERITEYLAVRKLRGGDPHGPILCFVGPPGTGKTSLGEAIALAITRAFYRISVGAVRDAAEIRGHRRTYVGAMPGLILQALRRVQVRDAVLRDRMEVIRVLGYTVEEKVEIAWRYMLPRLLEEHGISDKDIQFTDEVLGFISSRYSREAGLRNFERNIAALMRKRARKKADGEEGAWIVDNPMVNEILGNPTYTLEDAEQEPEIGAVTGMAWTATGGDLMVIEALRMPGSGRLTVTGQLGEVMRESVDAADSYVRSRAHTLGVQDIEFKEVDLHVHFPAGAIPKDGPSAGAAVTLAIASVLSRRPVRRDVALTGEMTLRGKVLEIGGVKEKVMAAYRAGLRQVLLPKANEKDLRGIPDEVVNSMTFTFVSTMDDIIHLALLPKPPGTFADAAEPHGDVEAKNAVSDSPTASINRTESAGAVAK